MGVERCGVCGEQPIEYAFGDEVRVATADEITAIPAMAVEDVIEVISFTNRITKVILSFMEFCRYSDILATAFAPKRDVESFGTKQRTVPAVSTFVSATNDRWEANTVVTSCEKIKQFRIFKSRLVFFEFLKGSYAVTAECGLLQRPAKRIRADHEVHQVGNKLGHSCAPADISRISDIDPPVRRIIAGQEQLIGCRCTWNDRPGFVRSRKCRDNIVLADSELVEYISA